MHLHGTFIKINGPIVIILLFFTNFLSFYRMSFFSSGILSKSHYTGLICLFSFFLVGTVSQTFPNFHGIDSVGKNKKVICSLSYHWDFTVFFFFFFLMIGLELWILGRNKKSSAILIISYLTKYMLLIQLVAVALSLIMTEVMLARFQH